MIRLFIIALLLSSCIETQAFDTSSLNYRDRQVAEYVFSWWNNHWPSRAGFRASSNSVSDIIYSNLLPASAGVYKTNHYNPLNNSQGVYADQIGIDRTFKFLHPKYFCALLKHELGHHPDLYGHHHTGTGSIRVKDHDLMRPTGLVLCNEPEFLELFP